ncbi:MAG: two-component regulator propeller domain-containing protein [Bacteroidota bacterium]
MMKSAICLCLLTLTLYLNSLYGQDQQFLFNWIGQEEDWANHSFNDIVQDQNGFIWFATYTGLVKYDGANTTVYGLYPPLANRLQSGKISCLLLDSKNRLWVGTVLSGLFRYNQLDDTFISYTQDSTLTERSLISNSIGAITEGVDGGIYIGTSSGVDRLNPEEGTVIHISEGERTKGRLNRLNVFSLAADPNGGVWVGTDCGLNKIVWDQIKEEAQIYSYYGPENDNEDSAACYKFIKTLKVSTTEEHRLWIGTGSGLMKIKYHPDSPAKVEYIKVESQDEILNKQNLITDIFEENPHRIWIATDQGLKLLNPLSGNVASFPANVQEPYHLCSDLIKSLYKDRFGNLWIGTGKGVCILNLKGNPFSKVSLFGNSQVRHRLTGIVPSSNPNKVWLSSNGGGIYNYDVVSGKSKQVRLADYGPKKSGRFISQITYDRDQNLWLATKGAGVIKVDGGKFQEGKQSILPSRVYSSANSEVGDFVTSIYAANKGSIWIGYWNKGLGRMNPRTGEVQNYTIINSARKEAEQDLKKYPIVVISESLDGQRIWAGTRGNGVFELSYDSDKDSLFLVNHFYHDSEDSSSLSNNFINCLVPAETGDMWVGTEIGLNLIPKDSNKTTRVVFDANNPSAVVSLLERDGEIWFSSKGRIFKLSYNHGSTKVEKYSDERMISKYFQLFGACEAENGMLLFLAAEELTKVDPSLIENDSSPPIMNFVSLKVNNEEILIGEPNSEGRPILNQHISQAHSIDLTYKENMVSIGFMGIHTAGKEKVIYAYKLEGLNEDWIHTNSEDRTAHFTNLPYKELTFMVKGRNASGIWSEPKIISIRVQPPWWLSDWAYACYTLLAIGLLLAIWKVGRMRAEFQHSLELEKVENQKIKEVSRIKQEFYTHLSHELKTPLTLIITPLIKLLETPAEKEELTYQHTMMHRNASKLLKMINQLLDIQKKEVGISGLKVTKGSLRKFIHEIYLSFVPLAEPLSIDYSFEANDGEEEVWFDPEELEKVVMNLLSNAFKFTPENGQIKVVVKKDKGKGSWYFSVEDNGAGIDPDKLEYVFERFYQVNGKGQRRLDQGSGIGLFLSSCIVEAHKGEITVESEPGVRTIFQVSLPVGNSHFSDEELMEENLDKYTLLEEGRRSSSLQQEISDYSQGGREKELVGKSSILVVDDNADIRAFLKTQLSVTYQVEEASNGEEAWELARRVVPDLVLADISMPIMDGLQLCHKLKTDMVTSHIPVILLTARSSFSYQFEGFQEGADAYVTKPFNFRLLEVRIRNFILCRKKLREKYSQRISFQPSKIEVTSLDEEFLQQVKEAIDTHFQETNFSVDQLAREVNMSRTQLYRKLKTLTGQSAKKIITDFRLKRAKDLLSANKYTVSEVSFMVGYNDIKSFRDQFKKAFNKNPRDFVAISSHSTS